MSAVARQSRRALRTGAAALAVLLATAGIAAAAGKPGYPDTVVWSGATWQVKTSNAAVGPGPCVFAKANVSVASGALHLKVQKSAAGAWTCAEVIGPKSYGYGTYTFTVNSRVDSLDPNVVLGLFTWSDKAPYAHREIDIEFARWANAADPTNGQYVVQPYGSVNHLKRFAQDALTASVQQFTWRAGSISWKTVDPATGSTVASYAYTGTDVPIPGDERVHLNLWLFNGAAPTNGAAVDVAVSAFSYTP